MNFDAFFWSILAGFLIVIPAGPIALLVIQRSIQCDTKSGIFTGLGSALADLIYILIAGFGVVLISSFIEKYELYFGLMGVGIVTVFGVKILLEKPVVPSKIVIDQRLLFDIFSGFGMSIINVGNLLLFSALFIYLQPFQDISRMAFVLECALGIFIGTMLWWSSVSYFVGHIKHTTSTNSFIIFHKISGWIMILLAIFLFIKILFFN